MRQADLSEILLGAFQNKSENHYYATQMRYPKTGGYYSFISKIADELSIECEKKVVKIDPSEHKVVCADGSHYRYRNLVSSLPLPVICRLLVGCPSEVKAAAQSLLWTTVDLISVGFKRGDIPPYLWFYLYDDDNLAARGYSPSLKSADNAPVNHSSLQFEIYNLSTNPRHDPSVLKRNIEDKLLEMEICSPDEIIFVHHKHLPFGNIVFDHGMEERRQIVLDYLSNAGIFTCGRFGEWDYLWSDQSFLSGKKATDHVR
jgi:protoporphyrinogen oxidase